MAKKREERKEDAKEEGSYEFPMPEFDERAFMRREMEGARIAFLTVGIGVATGILARLADTYSGDWRAGWLPILLAVATLQWLLRRLGFSEENTKPKAMLGNWFLVFFTGFALWVLLHNEPFNQWF